MATKYTTNKLNTAKTHRPLEKVPRSTSDKSLAKIRQQTLEISRKHKTTT